VPHVASLQWHFANIYCSTASKIVNKVLVIDTNTRLNIVGSLNVSIPTGSVATLSGGKLDPDSKKKGQLLIF